MAEAETTLEGNASAVMPVARVWPSVAECGRVWPSVAECGRVWPSVAECGRVWPSAPAYDNNVTHQLIHKSVCVASAFLDFCWAERKHKMLKDKKGKQKAKNCEGV